jgi:hypothetical protein
VPDLRREFPETFTDGVCLSVVNQSVVSYVGVDGSKSPSVVGVEVVVLVETEPVMWLYSTQVVE